MNVTKPSFSEILSDKTVYIWGCGTFGIMTHDKLVRHKIKQAGFLDSNPNLVGTHKCNVPIFHPDKVLLASSAEKAKSVILLGVKTKKFKDEMIRSCQENGLHENTGYIGTPYESEIVSFTMEASAICNLRCASCYQGNCTKGVYNGPSPFLSLENCVKAYDKLLKDAPDIGIIDLYNWGEPTLNPQLPQMIHEARIRNYAVNISSNLNYAADYAAIMKARPTITVVGLSGNEKTYHLKHTGGDWSVAHKNLRALADLQKEHNPDGRILLNYFVYRDTNFDDIKKMEEFAAKLCLKFTFYPAFLQPFDYLEAYVRGEPLPPAMRAISDLYVISVDEVLEHCRRSKEKRDRYCDVLTVDHNLEIRRCYLWHTHPDNDYGRNFLDTPSNKIVADKFNNPLCKRCRELGLNNHNQLFVNWIKRIVND